MRSVENEGETGKILKEGYEVLEGAETRKKDLIKQWEDAIDEADKTDGGFVGRPRIPYRSSDRNVIT